MLCWLKSPVIPHSTCTEDSTEDSKVLDKNLKFFVSFAYEGVMVLTLVAVCEILIAVYPKREGLLLPCSPVLGWRKRGLSNRGRRCKHF